VNHGIASTMAQNPHWLAQLDRADAERHAELERLLHLRCQRCGRHRPQDNGRALCARCSFRARKRAGR
jgi:hypothetical protein